MSFFHTLTNEDALRAKLDPTPCAIVHKLVQAGYEAYIVGGAIRDLLIGATPKDYDISTSATPEQVKKVFGHRNCHIIGRRFRLAHVYADGKLYEVSTFRRRPSVAERKGKYADDGIMIWNDNCFGTLHDDAGRRDFTVNSLYFDVVGKQNIIDLHGGVSDIRNRIVRVIGDPAERMDEDPVRMLRALKLVGKGEFTLEHSLENVIHQHAEKIKLASSARLFEELLKILAQPNAYNTLDIMHRHGFLKYYWPTMDESWEEPLGEFTRDLLKLRGQAMESGIYSNSRGLALATVTLPFMMIAMSPDAPNELWHRSIQYSDTAKLVLRVLFEGFKLPHQLAYRILTILELVPRLFRPTVTQRVLNNVEYRYSRALALLLAQHFGWDASAIENLPDGYTTPIPNNENDDSSQSAVSEEESQDEAVAEPLNLDSQDSESASSQHTTYTDDGNTITFAPSANELSDERQRAKRLRRQRRRAHKKIMRALANDPTYLDHVDSDANIDNGQALS